MMVVMACGNGGGGAVWRSMLVLVMVILVGSARGYAPAAAVARGHTADSTTTTTTTLPDVIIGDPNEPENDLLGPPISPKEVEFSVRTLGNDEGVKGGLGDFEQDPLTLPHTRYFEGDIVVDSKDHLLQIVQGDPEGQLSAIKNPQRTWPSGVIPYVISSTYSSSERGIIGQAMSEFAAKTCLRFVPRTSSHRDYIHILKGRGCSSNVGRAGGQQVVSLGNGCVHKGVVVHELMHAAGFWHEQSRSDRDSYVTINWNNIIRGLEYNFNKKSNTVTTDLGLAYDYDSVMHYGQYAFTRNRRQPTIVPRRSGVTIGQRRGLSQLDTKGLNLLYRCTGVGPVTTTTPPPTTCTDYNRYCSSWALAGYCTSNPGYMNIYCKKSCRVCVGRSFCEDKGKFCEDWARKGECTKNPAYMTTECSKSCGTC